MPNPIPALRDAIAVARATETAWRLVELARRNEREAAARGATVRELGKLIATTDRVWSAYAKLALEVRK